MNHASAGAETRGKCSESCFLVFLQEQEHGKQGLKGREQGKEEFFKGKCNQGFQWVGIHLLVGESG